MDIHQTHYQTLESTQSYLLDQLESLQNLTRPMLVTTARQTHGIGRRGTEWQQGEKAVAMSCTLAPHSTPTLTSLEIGVLLCEFFQKLHHKNLLLKWPNDLIFKGAKIGGIIVQGNSRSKLLVCGIGLNIGREEDDFPYSTLELSEDSLWISKELPREIYQFLLRNRISSHKEVLLRFKQHCAHLMSPTHLLDHPDHEYTFTDVGELGQAILQDENGLIKEIFSGSLVFKSFRN
jgi:BirA family transcriptional regulator, biotin operon repressor / biotin---[acetyl-CoA-carboxylase] ligase